MKQLGVKSIKINTRILSNYKIRPYLSQSVTLMNDENGNLIPSLYLDEVWNFSLSLVRMILDLQSFSFSSDNKFLKDEASLFVSLMHIVFVPFGSTGFKFLKATVKEQQKISIGEFLYKNLLERIDCPLNGNLFLDLTEEEMLYIKDFFMSFENINLVNCSNPKDVAAFACKLYFEFYGIDFQIHSKSNIKCLLESFLAEIEVRLFNLQKDEIFTFSISDYLSKLPKREELNSKEKKFILSKFNVCL